MAEPAINSETTDTQDSQSAGSASQQKKGFEEAQTFTSQASAKHAQSQSSRSTSTNAPSAAAIQRTLASQGQTAASLDGVLEGTRDRLAKSNVHTPSWPTSPRIKSPPPSTSRHSSRRNSTELAQANTAKRVAPVSAPELAAAMLLPESERERERETAKDTTQPQSQTQSQPASHLRVPLRASNASSSGLETVVEGSAPNTPSIEPRPDPMEGSQSSNINSDKAETSSNMTSSGNLTDSRSDTTITKVPTNKADNEPKSRATSTAKPSGNLAKRSFTSLTGNKKVGIEPVRTMTVETEPVKASTPGLGERNRDAGSVRTKTSTETIRPKKEKKKSIRKPTTLATGGGTSKADIFEHKVATAVDEADTSDSDETFVYESNPPEPRFYRHHSRTPSATSLTSTHDQFRSNKHGVRSGSAAIPGKKSMKFSNSIHQREYEDDPNRTASKNTHSTPRHHQIGRYGRNGHQSIFDNDSPFNQGRQPISPRSVTGNTKNSRPSSPRVSNGRSTTPRKYGGDPYDNNEDVADDERAPLISTVRVNRNRHSKRPHSREYREIDFDDDVDRRWWRQCSNCVVVFFLLLMITTLLAAFVAGVNRPLCDVEIKRIINVLVSEQELMLDLDVRAINPNLFAITITDLDVNVFAESPYVGTSATWQGDDSRKGPRSSFADRRKRGWFWPDPALPDNGVDEGTDPEDPENGIQKMLLGRVPEFDSPLTFDPTPVRRSPVSSVGEIRLSKPGNKTEIGGSQRWERVLKHDFDLIVRGVLKYQLPLGWKTKTVKVGSRKTIHPDDNDRALLGL